MNLHSIKRIVVLFWGLYFTIVVATNLCDALKEVGVLSTTWPFASGNFGFIQQVISIYSLPDGIAWVVYIIIILLEVTIALHFWKAFLNREGLESSSGRSVISAFGFAISLWCIFILADELFITYERLPGSEGGHVTGLIAQVVTLVLVLFVPWGAKNVEP